MDWNYCFAILSSSRVSARFSSLSRMIQIREKGNSSKSSGKFGKSRPSIIALWLPAGWRFYRAQRRQHLLSNSANAVDRRARIPDRREAGQQRTSCRERERPANSDRMPAVRLRRRPDHDLRMRCSISLPRIATSIGSGAPGHISASHC
jgi:hypothetical protein